jgi:hypothetical protein
MRRISPEVLLQMANYHQPMVCAPAFHALEHLVRANQYSRKKLNDCRILDTMLDIMRQRGDNRRITKMVMKILAAVDENWVGEPSPSLIALRERRDISQQQ